ncbi:hypothetical protein BD626DRAFT_473695 [Schizophyllum amplum]|uniref:Uncharacterized protein n=1 Tax=Schizophyllum amplum TaxID=97359 RepID=A0A550CX31_9AGAR|nr:hypothetical protein BD626DRAFT_473695 [Auriculariopsis ampla]
MDSDDEYDFPDLNSDDLAVIDETAAKFYSQHPQAPTQPVTPSTASAPRPGPSKPTLGKRKSLAADDADSLPDITIVDGGYALGPDVKRPRVPLLQSHPPSQFQRAKRQADIEEALKSRSQTPVQKPPPRPNTRAPAQRQLSKQNIPHLAPPAPLPSQHVNRARGPSPMPARHPPPKPAPRPAPQYKPTPAVQPVLPTADVYAHRQLEELRAQIEALKQENEKTKASLMDEKRARWSKDGEISHLKDTLSKTTESYITQAAKLRAAKEEAERQQSQLQRNMKDEIERIKTQFLFKQQELESRRPPASVKPKKPPRAEPSTPMPMPSQMRGWSNATAGPSRLVTEDDIFGGRPFPSQVRRSPTKPRSPEKTRKPALGFQNSFAASTPAPQRRKGKQKENVQQPAWESTQQQPGFDWTVQSPPVIPSPPHSPTLGVEREAPMQIDAPAVEPPGPALDGDVEMGDADDIVAEEFDDIEPIDWMSELSYLVLTHRMPDSTSTTLEVVMRANAQDEASLRICTGCNQVLEIIGTHTKPPDYTSAAKAISLCLIDLLYALLDANCIPPLLHLLNLMSAMIYSLPNVSSFFLSLSTDATESRVLNSIRLLLGKILKTLPENDRQVMEAMACQLLCALAWNAPSDLMTRHRLITLDEHAMATLIDPADPSARLLPKVQYLVQLSTQRSLVSSLLCLEPMPIMDDAASTPAKTVYVDRLCGILTDPARRDAQSLELKSLILTFCAMVSVGHADALSALHNSLPFIPSLVHFIMQLTNPLWEEDEALTSAPAKANEYIRLANQTVYLLRHVVKGREADLNLRHKLNHTPHRIFNGIMHHFVVAFGRLSYADAPDWVDQEGKDELQLLQGYAEELLHMVIDGPEGEAVWGTYQMDTENSSEAGEDEMEAEMLG